jgi:DNA-binding transcriptional LysR family regulator
MDSLAAFRAFVSVAESGSFTLGSAAVGIPQSVASRRVAALERELGGELIDRSGRRATSTRFGERLLPQIRYIVQLTESLYGEAERIRGLPLRIAVPESCTPHRLAQLSAAALDEGMTLHLHPAAPHRRRAMLRTNEVDAALLVDHGAGDAWSVPLGVGAATAFPGAAFALESVRSRRGLPAGRRRRLWVPPEDDVPAVRDQLMRMRDALGLPQEQVRIAGTAASAIAQVLVADDLIICSPAEAAEHQLEWAPLRDSAIGREYTMQWATGSVPAALPDHVRAEMGRCLGAGDAPTPAERTKEQCG